MKKFWVLSVVAVFFAWDALGQQPEFNPKSEFNAQTFSTGSGFGFVAGLASGLGIGYREHFANKWGLQIAGGAVGWSDWVGADLGIQAMRTLSKVHITRFYLLGALSAFYHTNKQHSDPPQFEAKDSGMIWKHTLLVNIGAGVGMEFHFSKNIGLALEVPLSLTIDFGSNGTKFEGIWPIPSAALIYYF